MLRKWEQRITQDGFELYGIDGWMDCFSLELEHQRYGYFGAYYEGPSNSMTNQDQ